MIKLKSYTLNQLNNYHLALVGVIHYLPTTTIIGGKNNLIENAREEFKTSFPPYKYAHSKCSVIIPIGVKLVSKRYRDDFVQASFGCFNLENYEVHPTDVGNLQDYKNDPETHTVVLQEDFPLLMFWNLGAFYDRNNDTKPAFGVLLENSYLGSERTFTLNALFKLGLFHSTYSYEEHRTDLEEQAQPTFFLKHFGSCKVPKDNNYLFGALDGDFTFFYTFCQDNPKYDY